MEKIAELFVCRSKDYMFCFVVTANGEVFMDKITPHQLKDGTAEAYVVANGAYITASGIFDDIIATLQKITPTPSCGKKEQAEVVAS